MLRWRYGNGRCPKVAGDARGGRSARRHQQVHVVGHQYIGVHVAVAGQCDFAQVLQVALVVDSAEEAGLAVVATLDDMLGDAGQIDPRLPCHGLAPLLEQPTLRGGGKLAYRKLPPEMPEFHSDPGFRFPKPATRGSAAVPAPAESQAIPEASARGRS